MATTDTEESDTATETKPEKLGLTVKINQPGTCERHVIVTIPRVDLDRYFRKAFDDLRPRAELPGFRVGKAPRKLIESKFKDQITAQVKSSLLMDSLQQVTEGGSFSAISEPDLDYEAIEIPDTGDFTYEFKIEVRPEFESPNWKGLSLNRPFHAISDLEVDQQLARTLARFSNGEPVDGGAQPGDSLMVNIVFEHNGKQISHVEEERVVLHKKLSFADAVLDDFDTLMTDVREGQTRVGNLTISDKSDNETLRGQEVTAAIEVIEVSRLNVDELNASTLSMLGFDNAAELRSFVRQELEKQLSYRQQQSLREQITAELTKNAQWDLPPELVRRQTNRELQRQSLELRRSGFSDEQIRSFMNTTRRNAQEVTIKALREHFVLERIAEDLKLDPAPEEYDAEIKLIADQSDTSERRVRARLEKSGQMDALRNQIIERRVIEMVTEEAQLTDKEDASFLSSAPEEAAIEHLVAPVSAILPEAKYDEKPEDSRTPGSTVKPT